MHVIVPAALPGPPKSLKRHDIPAVDVAETTRNHKLKPNTHDKPICSAHWVVLVVGNVGEHQHRGQLAEEKAHHPRHDAWVPLHDIRRRNGYPDKGAETQQQKRRES